MAEIQIQIQNPSDNTNHFLDISDKFDTSLTLQSSSSSSTSPLIDDEEHEEAGNGVDENLTTQPSTSTTHQINEVEDDDDDDDEEDDDQNEEFEFCFFGEAIKSPVSAEEVFEGGQIRIVSPFPGEISDSGDGESSNGPPVKKLFVVSNSSENDDMAEGPYCVWEGSTPEMSKKSNSTGFSKLWKVRDLLSRSNSDGKDAFVFLKNDDTTSVKERRNKVKLENIEVGKKCETTAYVKNENSKKKKKKSAYEVFYGENKNKGGNNGKSYLPYRVGFFTNGSGMSRNVHPY